MAITEDASTPAVATGTDGGTTTTSTKTITSASFSPPANSLLVALVNGGWGNGSAEAASVTDSVGGTWTAGPAAVGTATGARGVAAIFYRYLSSAPGSMTVTGTVTNMCGGRQIAVRVLNGAASSQAGAGTGTAVNSTATTSGTVSVTTTVTGSQVYGTSDNCGNASSLTVNGATSILSGGDFNNTTDTVRLVVWKATSATGTPGATTLGGTWSPTAATNNIAAMEILPATAATFNAAVTLSAVSTLTAALTTAPKTTMAAVSTLTATLTPPVIPTFPQIPRDTIVELFLNNTWIDVTNDVYARDRVTISRGGKDENSGAEPATCQLTLNNRSGNYSPRNPNSVYYGSIGRNNPIRVTIEHLSDTFTRTVVNSWGAADTGQAWTAISQGTFTASDFQVSGGVGTHSVSVRDTYRYNYTASNSWRDVDVAVTATLPFTTVTGDSVFFANILLRWQDLDTYYMVAPEVFTDGHVYLSMVHFDAVLGKTIIASAVDTGIIHSSSQALRVRAQAEGRKLRAKVWPAAGSEPYAWTVTVNNDSIDVGGGIGIRSYVATGNTNTLPVVFSYDNVTVRSPRFFGEVSAWPQRWDLSGNDVYSPIEAAGVRRRLGQGVSPVRSSMRRYWSEVVSDVVAYWPMEDGKESVAIAAGRPNVLPMTVTGSVKFGTYDELPSSAPLVTLDKGWTAGSVPSYVSTGDHLVRWFLHAPATPLPDVTVLSQIYCSGSILAWQVTFRNANGAISIQAFDRSGVGVLDTGAITFALVDTKSLVSLRLTQSGGNINWTFVEDQLGDTILQQSNGTIAGTIGNIVLVGFDPYQACADTAVGHCVVRRVGTDPVDQLRAFNAWSGDPASIGGETMGQRVDRLASENNIAIGGRGSRSNTGLAGPQRVDTLLNLLDFTVASDLGILTEMKGDAGLSFRTRSSLYNQTVALNLDYTGGQVSPPLEPTDDDQQTRNDITVTRDGGSDVRAQLLTGRLSVTDSGAGGVGRYDEQVTVSVAYDSQLANIATWLLNAGTTDETRYPTVTVEIANPNVTALDTQILDVDVGDRITISNPKTGQTPDLISQIVRGYTEVIEPFSHEVTFNCSPESPYAVIRLDTAGHKLDSDTSTLASGVSSSATSLSVATTDPGNLWVTGAVSILIRVAGEVMNVTNISGTSSPQTFTVTRSVNNIVKAQAAGAVVSLFREATLAL